MISQLKTYYDQIKENFNETVTVTFSVEVHSQILRFLNQDLVIGTLIPKRERECFPLPVAEMRLEEFAVELEAVVEIDGPGDTNFLYTGVTYLQFL
ncbi:hypothetical protein ACJMK2_013639 [Sinanodonta woodiana]|uniref:Uncharacterized protein n=1 Tax=Sinanodonta woodiana TaxID=1069815 RepID=A0ABD3UYR6_SINWO